MTIVTTNLTALDWAIARLNDHYAGLAYLRETRNLRSPQTQYYAETPHIIAARAIAREFDLYTTAAEG